MYVHVRVTPGAKKERVSQKNDTEFEIFVREKAERNMANRRIMELLGVAFQVPTTKVKMLTGHRSPSKIFDVGV